MLNCVGASDRRTTYKALQFIARKASGTAMLLNLQNPLTCLSRVRRRWLIARSRIFDRKWYHAEYPESGVAGLDPIMHYLLAGADRGYRPHLLFDPAWYMKARGGWQRDQNPLIDYISYGAREGIHPSPYFAPISRRHKRDRSLSARCRDAIHVLARDRPFELRKQCFAGLKT